MLKKRNCKRNWNQLTCRTLYQGFLSLTIETAHQKKVNTTKKIKLFSHIGFNTYIYEMVLFVTQLFNDVKPV